MSYEEMFIKASREKMRFSYKGVLTVEDLWDLPVTELDKIYKSLNAKAKESAEESLLSESTEDETLNTQIEIIKYIVSIKLDERDKAKKAKERKEQKEKIMSIIASKQDEALQGKSIDELTKLLDELD